MSLIPSPLAGRDHDHGYMLPDMLPDMAPGERAEARVQVF